MVMRFVVRQSLKIRLVIGRAVHIDPKRQQLVCARCRRRRRDSGCALQTGRSRAHLDVCWRMLGAFVAQEHARVVGRWGVVGAHRIARNLHTRRAVA